MRFGWVNDEICRHALESSYVLGTEGVYFVGPFVERVSFASQQLRAFNLAWALTKSEQLKPADKVAIVGAGLSGVSAATGLLAKGMRVSLFEKEERELFLQKDTFQRYVHPTVNRWPVSPLSFTTKLPFLDWCEGLCGDVIDEVYQEWMNHFEHLLVEKILSSEVIGFEEKDDNCFLSVKGAAAPFGPYKCVIFATGFGDEAMIDESILGSYWIDDEEFEESLPRLKGEYTISGLGDGALIEAIRLLYPQFEFGKFAVDTARFLHSRDYTKILSDIEKKARRVLHDHTQLATHIHDEYTALIPELPYGFRTKIGDNLRRNLKLELIGPEEYPFVRNAAPIHQLLVAWAIKEGALRHTRGWIRHSGSELWVEQDGAKLKDIAPNRHISRLGPDRDLSNLLTPSQIERLRDAQTQRSDYLFALRPGAFDEHKIATRPQWDPTSKPFIASRKSAAEAFMLKRFNVNVSIDYDNDRPCFGAPYFVEKNVNPQDMPDELFGIKVNRTPVFEGDEFSSQIGSIAVDVATGRDPNRKQIIRPLDVNSIIRRQGGNQQGRIGVFAVDQSTGELFAATAAHSVQTLKRMRHTAIISESGEKIGRLSESGPLAPRAPTLNDIKPISSAVIWFKVNTNTPVKPTSFGANKTIFSTPLSHLGSDVFSANRQGARGRIVSVDAVVKLRNNESKKYTTYSGAMIVESTSHSPFATHGDSGALVNAPDGSPIGIVIGGNGDKVVVAPIRDALSGSKLHVPNHDFIRRWNRRASPQSDMAQIPFIKKHSIERNYNSALKRAMDLLVGVTALVMLGPLMIALAIWIRLSDGGPAIIRLNRIAKDGRSIRVFKFRTMVVDATARLEQLLQNDPAARAEWETTQKLRSDPRITPMGVILRKSSMDELPQLFNVLLGEMSMVGPKPISQDEVQKYGDNFAIYASVKPGITGLWQVTGRSELSYEERVHRDVQYVTDWSIWLDLKILLQTIPAALSSRGAY